MKYLPHSIKIFFLLLFFLFSCKKSTEPLLFYAALQLSVADVSCTEAWLHLKTEQTEKAENEKDLVLQVFRDDSLVVNKNWDAGDSLIYFDGLQPNTSYAFIAKVVQGDQLLAASPKVTATTMDTTSHDFTWQTYEFGGQGGSSSFYDVAIIDENDIWAVGEIYTADDKYNAAHWNGEKWELKKIKTRACGGVEYPPILSVFSFADGTIVLGHTDGSLTFSKNQNYINDCSLWDKVRGTAKKIWGISKKDFYVVGYNGFIAHYNGRQWQRITNEIDIDINDVWGIRDGKNVYCCGTYDNRPGSFLFVIKENKIKAVIDVTANEFSILNYELSGFFESGWAWNKLSFHILSTSGVYRCSLNGEILGRRMSFTDDYLPGYPTRIRGNGFNDFFISGKKSMLAHFNGKTWRLFNTESPCTNFYSLAEKGNITIAVGKNCKQWGEGVILMGRR